MNYKRIYDQLIERARNRVPEGYVERHHIIPKCMGGADDNENLVALYPEEHFVAHVLLLKIYPEHPGLISAVQQMTAGHEGKRTRRKLYGWLKRRFAAYMRESQTGSGNSQYGTMWITDGVSSRKIDRTNEIPEGWSKGRTVSRKTTPSPLKGRKRIFKSEESRLQFSIKQRSKKMPESAKEKISKANLGRVMSQETKDKISNTKRLCSSTG